MAERVNTGGVMSFNYSKSEKSKLSEEQKEDLEKGYDEYYSRRKKERRKKFFIILLIVVLILTGILAWLI